MQEFAVLDFKRSAAGLRIESQVTRSPEKTIKRTERQKTEIVSLAGQAQQYAGEAIAVLVDIVCHTKSHAARLAAITTLLDRGFGKPPKSLPIATAEPTPESSDLSIEEAVAEFQKLREKIMEKMNDK